MGSVTGVVIEKTGGGPPQFATVIVIASVTLVAVQVHPVGSPLTRTCTDTGAAGAMIVTELTGGVCAAATLASRTAIRTRCIIASDSRTDRACLSLVLPNHTRMRSCCN